MQCVLARYFEIKTWVGSWGEAWLNGAKEFQPLALCALVRKPLSWQLRYLYKPAREMSYLSSSKTAAGYVRFIASVFARLPVRPPIRPFLRCEIGLRIKSRVKLRIKASWSARTSRRHFSRCFSSCVIARDYSRVSSYCLSTTRSSQLCNIIVKPAITSYTYQPRFTSLRDYTALISRLRDGSKISARARRAWRTRRLIRTLVRGKK